ncbi:hypothetical protein D9M70_623630 [compost metagenome]
MQAAFANPDAVKQRMFALERERVPADLRDLQCGISGRHLDDIAGDPAEAVGDGLFEPARRHQLHADADAEERPGGLFHRFGQRLLHAVDGGKATAAVGIGTDTRKHDAVGARHPLRLVGEVDLG